MKQDIKSFSLPKLQALFAQLGEPAYRAKQVFGWLHKEQVCSFSQMTNLPKKLQAQLDTQFTITAFEIVQKLVSRIDGTTKYLYRLSDGNLIESVWMQYKHGNSVCISTQVGCKMGCKFCASTIAGYVRNLTVSEMLEQVYAAQRDSGQRVSNVVLMGIGEPLDNYDNVLSFLKLVSDEAGSNLSLRHVSVSTCGLVPMIDQLATEQLGITLSVSLHAPNDEIRSNTMPINHKYNIEQLLDACNRYAKATGRRISYEYALIEGVNDSRACALQLASKLKGTLCHVNLIAVNTVAETPFRSSKHAQQFMDTLNQQGINTTIRRTLGADINAACGQLRRQSQCKGEG